MIPPFATQVLAQDRSDEDRVRHYHERTKHRPDRFAPGPETLDWECQPAPFRRFEGSPEVLLPLGSAPDPGGGLSLAALAALLRLSFSITAWKSQGPDRWAVRATPSSGNLHPVEAYVIAKGLAGLEPGVHHYRPDDHALELRARFAVSPGGRATPALWVALTTIGWREVWKYGERGFRYCQLDVGHAIAALGYAAMELGWVAREEPQVASRTLGRALGLDRVDDFPGGRWASLEREEAETLVAIEVHPGAVARVEPGELETAAGDATWHGTGSRIDPHPMYEWPVIADVTRATQSAFLPRRTSASVSMNTPTSGGASVAPNIDIILGRRSAQRFDDLYTMDIHDLFGLLGAINAEGPIHDILSDSFHIDLLVFVQRVTTVAPGVYVSSEEPAVAPCLAARLGDRLAGPLFCSGQQKVGLRRLAHVEPGALARLARGLHCNQSIAAQACLSLGMLASFDAPLAEDPANYRRLHRQAGLLGQILYIEAERRELRGTGIGCFFDDAVHEVARVTDTEFQSLYHFVVGKAVADPHLESAPPYPDRNLRLTRER